MKEGDWVLWKDNVGEIVTVFNEGDNLVIRVPEYKIAGLPTKIMGEVLVVKTIDTTPIPKEVADIVRGG